MKKNLFGAISVALLFGVSIYYSYRLGQSEGYNFAKSEFDNCTCEDDLLDLHAYFLDPIEVDGVIKYNVWDIESSYPIMVEGSLSEIDSTIIHDNL